MGTRLLVVYRLSPPIDTDFTDIPSTSHDHPPISLPSITMSTSAPESLVVILSSSAGSWSKFNLRVFDAALNPSQSQVEEMITSMDEMNVDVTGGDRGKQRDQSSVGRCIRLLVSACRYNRCDSREMDPQFLLIFHQLRKRDFICLKERSR